MVNKIFSFRRCIEFLRDAIDQLDGRSFGRIAQWMIFSSVFQDRYEAYLLTTVPLVMEMVNAIPNCRLRMVKDGGHVQHWENLGGYNRVTLDFLLEQAK